MLYILQSFVEGKDEFWQHNHVACPHFVHWEGLHSKHSTRNELKKLSIRGPRDHLMYL